MKNGIAAAIGSLHKSFTEVEILNNSTNDLLQRITIMKGTRYLPRNYPNSKKLNNTMIKDYFQMQELYLSQIQD